MPILPDKYGLVSKAIFDELYSRNSSLSAAKNERGNRFRPMRIILHACFFFPIRSEKRNSPYCGGPPANRLCFRKTNHCRHAKRCENVTKAGVFRRRFLCFFLFLQGFFHYFIEFQRRNCIDFRQNVCYNMRTGGHFLSLTVEKTEIPRFPVIRDEKSPIHQSRYKQGKSQERK